MRGVYIHVPFCKSICTYCDFCKMYKNDDLIKKYLKKLSFEVEENYLNDVIKTIYIGGGTPSCLSKNELKSLFKITKKIKLSKNYEFTFECNINDINENLLMFLKENNVNRLSIGVESFNEKLLKIMGRKNTDVAKKIKLAKSYFSNINVDLIYGLNNETMDDLDDDLKNFLKLDVPHISIYCLILEDNTILKINNYQELDSDIERQMYDRIRKVLRKNDYIHYEISNFCKKNYHSRHNMIYWNNEEYYGFGLGAGGFINNIRYENTRSINNYLKGKIRLEEEKLDEKTNMENEMILGLRKINGVSRKKFYKKYHKNIEEVFDVSKLNKNNNNYYISKKYIYVENSILTDFIDKN
ncbi:MAG: radical SAM family heme chaperone HemW [bacterium]|nr:radical SAM family heme chaperone HemW [bacterium]